MTSLERVCEAIYAVAHKCEGRVVAPADFKDLASRSIVQRAFAELASCGVIMRLSRGIYAATKYNRRFGWVLPPSPELVIASLCARGEIIYRCGAAEANVLGLSTQVPMVEAYWSSGPTRTLLFGARNVELIHVEKWLLGGGRSGQLTRARKSLGPRSPGRKRNYNF